MMGRKKNVLKLQHTYTVRQINLMARIAPPTRVVEPLVHGGVKPRRLLERLVVLWRELGELGQAVPGYSREIVVLHVVGEVERGRGGDGAVGGHGGLASFVAFACATAATVATVDVARSVVVVEAAEVATVSAVADTAAGRT
jgi:hypothetical protein